MKKHAGKKTQEREMRGKKMEKKDVLEKERVTFPLRLKRQKMLREEARRGNDRENRSV